MPPETTPPSPGPKYDSPYAKRAGVWWLAFRLRALGVTAGVATLLLTVGSRCVDNEHKWSAGDGKIVSLVLCSPHIINISDMLVWFPECCWIESFLVAVSEGGWE